MKKPLPIGIDLFDTVMEKDYFYIDKSLFIKELLEYKNQVTLINRPRRFGKTLNMSMLQCFFDIRQENRDLFKGLKINEINAITDRHQNKYPVIFVTLKSMKSTSYKNSLDVLAQLMSRLYSKNEYIYESGVLRDYQKDYFYSILSMTAPEERLKLSISTLMEYMYLFYKQKVILLIDEYDAPIDNAELEGFYPEMIKFMRGFFGDALKTNEHLEFSVITGVQRIAKEGLFSDLNNLTVCGILDNYYGDCFGFTEEEVVNACKDYDLHDDINEVKRYYDGYNFSETDIYNPWSIINYLQARCLDKFWVNTGSTAILKNIFVKGTTSLKIKAEGLLMDIPVEMELGSHIVYPIRYEDTDIFWTLLLYAGYVKPVSGSNKNKSFYVILVNNEVKEAFRVCINEWLKDAEGEFAKGLKEFITALTEGDAKGIEIALNTKLLPSTSYHDMVSENSYHMFILGMLQFLGDEYNISSNREEYQGRADLTLRPKDMSKAAVIIELKYVKNKSATKKSVQTVAKSGLKQIEAKNYDADIKAEGYNQIYKYSIAFSGKYCITDAVI